VIVRKVSFVVRPTSALAALLAFAHATRTHRSGLGDRLDREVRGALEGVARTLDPVLGALRWLSRRGFARHTGPVDATGLAAEGTVTFDLRASVTATQALGPRVDGRAATDLYALRALVRSLRQTDQLACDKVLLGRQSETTRALLRAIEGACRETALGDESLVPKAFARAVPAPSTPGPAASPMAEPKAKAKARPTRGASPKAAAPGAGAAFFGGLPDDATSPPTAPPVPLSARGLTVDAEFFLESARLKLWPCSTKALTRARRAVLVALHPDRAGEGSEGRFRSALKGFEELAVVLAAMSAPAAAAPPATRPATPVEAPVAVAASVPTVRAPFSAVGQWPLPPPAVDAAPVATAPAPRRRQSFIRSSKA
jgi:hypothetical protein